jgi:hypothetical protein
MSGARPLAFARYYARHVGPVFPLKPHDKIPLGTLAPQGFKNASTDQNVIGAWWTRAPDAGIGLCTGRASGTVVLDVDPRHGGDVSLARLEAEHGQLPETVEAITGGGGRHLIFNYPAGDVEIRNCTRLGDLPGLDVRAEGGYIAVAPTIHPNGKPYRWRADRNPKIVQRADLPDWLLAMMIERGNGNGSRPGIDTAKILEGVPEGERDEDLWGLACKLRGADVPIEAAYELVATAASKCVPPFDLQKAYEKVRRAYARYKPGVRGEFPRAVQAPEPIVLSPATADDLLREAARPIEWVTRPLDTVKSIRILGGPAKGMKTGFAMAKAITMIKGGTLAGHFDSDGGHCVAWFDAETTPRSWSRKFLAFCRGLGHDPRDLLESGRIRFFNRAGLYLDEDRILEATIEAARKVDATEIVLDSLTRIHRQKENDSGAMSAFFTDRIFRLRDEVGAGVTILHHVRKPALGFRDDPADAIRGTGDLRAVVDTQLAISRSRKDRALYTITVSGQRDVPEVGPFHVALEWPEDGPATFCSAEAPPAEPEYRSAGRPPSASDTARRILGDAIAKKRDLTFTDAIRLCDEAGIGKTTAKAAWREVKYE